ncbi:hypothetical protein BHM03_00020904 [Ensete ventricosum]|nr:hypothetical protein BHM03_00020904 [Ensete ventricosum]
MMGSDSRDSRKDSSAESADRKQQQEMMMMSSTASMTGETRNPQPSSQEKRKMTGSTTVKDGKVLDAKKESRIYMSLVILFHLKDFSSSVLTNYFQGTETPGSKSSGSTKEPTEEKGAVFQSPLSNTPWLFFISFDS